jgi:O-antigen/teichoic acid export membrane protein
VLTSIFGLHAVVGNTDMLMLGMLADDKAVGLYRVSLQCALLSTAVVGAITVTVQPQIAELYAKGETEMLQSRIVAVNRAALLVASVATVMAVAVGKPVLGAVFGSEYALAAPTLVILALGQLAYGLFGPAIHILNMTGHEREAIGGLAIGAAVNAVGCLVLVPSLKQEGAAIAATLALFSWQAVLAGKVSRLTGLASWRISNSRRR